MFPNVIANLIAEYAKENILLDWIDKKRLLQENSLSKNPAAIDLLRENKDKIYWGCLSENSAAIGLLRENLDKIHWASLSKNQAAIDLSCAPEHHNLSNPIVNSVNNKFYWPHYC